MRVIEHSLFAKLQEDVNNVSLHTELYRGQYRLRQFLHNRVYTFLQQNRPIARATCDVEHSTFYIWSYKI